MLRFELPGLRYLADARSGVARELGRVAWIAHALFLGLALRAFDRLVRMNPEQRSALCAGVALVSFTISLLAIRRRAFDIELLRVAA